MCRGDTPTNFRDAVPVATYRLDLQYDGTGFHGYARNPGVRTVQGELETALATILGTPVATTVAGRTDAGVHARGQVVSFQAGIADVERVERSLRSMLGPEVAVIRLARAADGFHARFDASGRTYRYFVDEAEVVDPLTRSTVWHVGEPLDVAAMNTAAAAFLGTHDFASVCRTAPGKTTVRNVRRAEWWREERLVVFEVEAKAFCHQMVRSIVALCVAAGRGRLDPAAIPEILEARDRNAARGTAPAHGLVLWEVAYQDSGAQ